MNVFACQNFTCVNKSVKLFDKFNITLNKTYIFPNESIRIYPQDNISFFNKTISIIPSNVSYSINCSANITNSTIHYSGLNFRTCKVVANEISPLNGNNFTDEKIFYVDEPKIMYWIKGSEFEYRIDSMSPVFLYAYKNGNKIFESNKKEDSFTSSGKIKIVYGNLAGDKTLEVKLESSSSGGSSSGGGSSGGGGSGLSGGGSVGSSSESVQKSHKENKTVQNVSKEKLNNVFNREAPKVKVYGITGNYIDINKGSIPWTAWLAVGLIFVVFLIFKLYRKVERRIIE